MYESMATSGPAAFERGAKAVLGMLSRAVCVCIHLLPAHSHAYCICMSVYMVAVFERFCRRERLEIFWSPFFTEKNVQSKLHDAELEEKYPKKTSCDWVKC